MCTATSITAGRSYVLQSENHSTSAALVHVKSIDRKGRGHTVRYTLGNGAKAALSLAKFSARVLSEGKQK